MLCTDCHTCKCFDECHSGKIWCHRNKNRKPYLTIKFYVSIVALWSIPGCFNIIWKNMNDVTDQV